ncbi:hypothetical protein ACFPL7_02650 [Dongia soli]|uniref:Uncharacterized protein n=1 Tax=Dongia soli TaxID=600628 RepID=A0ABU5EIN4_9PROT|nr:hypothetical protein [Dongia soli]MDY0885171.1 hypothetical protein [Dongia soli]
MLLVSLGFCAFALEVEAARVYDLIDTTQVMAPAIILFLALTATYVVRLRSIFRRPRALVGFLLMAGIYADASTVHLNAILASAPTQAYQATTLNKEMTISNSRRSKSRNWHLTLAPWGPLTAQTEISVHQALYDRVPSVTKSASPFTGARWIFSITISASAKTASNPAPWLPSRR